MLIVIIPPLKKEPETLNSFLQPVVDELLLLAKGFQLKPANRDPVQVKVLLL